MELTKEFFNYLALLLSLMAGFTLFKVAACKPFKEDGEQFSLKKLLLRTSSKLIVLLGVMLVFATSCQCGEELLLIEIAGVQLTIHAAIKVTILAIVAIWGVKFIKNLAEYFGLGTKFTNQVDAVDASDIVNGTSSCSCGCKCCHNGKLIGYLYSAEECDCDDDCDCDQTDFNDDTSVSDDSDEEAVG